ncbi:hypothetical protein N7541_004165 [Penicillium brevicompactum]|uniref:Ubiquitin-like 1-activating enzyme E1A n=1 Tax=Penicillium brevicompactum TaxID=5074 RepID=A0A9W9RNM0_PENBR|nr:hypothetical protein N7541_004165 [Penicillium brevicompactum]
MEPQENAQSISADEIALYDRQIRLWGVQAQEKIRSANILLITAKALANEVAKNLVLAGIGSLTIIDHQDVTEEDLGAQFFVAEAQNEGDVIGKNRAEVAGPQIRKMNPRVKLNIDTSDVKTKQPEFFAQFDITIATELDFVTNTTINAACRLANKPFYAAGLHGFYGYAFADLISHDFVIERSKSNLNAGTQETQTRSIVSKSTKTENDKVIELVTKREVYSPSSSRTPRPSQKNTLVFRAGANKSPHSSANLGSELSPVAAFLGGSLAQDVINVLSAREQPLQNILLFDGEKMVGPIYPLHPFFPEDLAGAEMGAVPPVRNPVTVPVTGVVDLE